jgi:lysophospholipase L1-like esterase
VRTCLAVAALALASCGESPLPVGKDGALPDTARSEGLAFRDSASPVGDRAAGERAADLGAEHRDSATPPGLANVTLFVNLGDSLGAGYYASAGHSYRALLLKNDDVLYPAYKGRDLKGRFPAIGAVDKAKSGATTADALAQAKTVAGNPAGATVVVVSAGGNDFNDNVMAMIDPVQIALIGQKAVDNLGKIVDHFSNKAAFLGQLYLVLLDVHDPTDGAGSIPALPNLGGFCQTILKLGPLVGPIVVSNLGGFNAGLAKLAQARKLLFPDNHTAFLGHGFHYNDPQSPHYKAADPTLWFWNDCTHGNDRGHHELRRLIWKALTGESG